MKIDFDSLKRKAGRKPFDERIKFVDGYAACPFHNGDSPKSMHITEKGGAWIATCFSACQKSWDAIAFVMQYDHVEFGDALKRLQGEPMAEKQQAQKPEQEKPKPKPMTEAEWLKYGRELTTGDIERLAKSRKDKTANFETFKALGCRVKGDCIAFPYRRTLDGNVVFDAVRLRHLDTKDFAIEHSVSLQGLFNIDTVNPLEDVYVVEGEPDVAIMEEGGYRAVSVTTGAQKKFDPQVIKVLNIAPRIFIVGDQAQDGADPGQKCMDGLQKLLPFDKTFRIKFTEAKDVSELAKKLGDSFSQRIEELRDESLTPWVMRRGNVQLIGTLDPKPQKWTIDRMLPYGGLAMVSGDAGAMKTLLALFAAKAMTFQPGRGFRLSELGETGEMGRFHEGEGFLGRRIPREVPVLYLDRENPQSTVSERVFKSGLMARHNFWYWGDWSQDPTPEPDDPRLLEFAIRGGYIIFDSLQDWYGEASEVDNTAMVALMHKFKHLARLGAGVLILHHNAKPSKNTPKQFRGGTAIQALTDMAIQAEKDENDESIVRLSPGRFRMCAPWILEFQATFPTPERPMYGIEPVSDMLTKDIAKHAFATKAESEAKREAEEAEESARLSAQLANILSENPKIGLRTLGEMLEVSAPTAAKLAKKAGWHKDDELGWLSASKSSEGGVSLI